jgi:hypothetical protein
MNAAFAWSIIWTSAVMDKKAAAPFGAAAPV